MKNWKEDKVYQKKQAERLARLKAKDGYEANIARGIVEKDNEKQARKKRRLAKLKEKKI